MLSPLPTGSVPTTPQYPTVPHSCCPHSVHSVQQGLSPRRKTRRFQALACAQTKGPHSSASCSAVTSATSGAGPPAPIPLGTGPHIESSPPHPGTDPAKKESTWESTWKSTWGQTSPILPPVSDLPLSCARGRKPRVRPPQSQPPKMPPMDPAFSLGTGPRGFLATKELRSKCGIFVFCRG